ncbi:MAG: AlpA family phage regulatory protein [Desulfovibrio sp.]|nr:AlpA family phage regulatory protein [Desulfovibrio sp.]
MSTDRGLRVGEFAARLGVGKSTIWLWSKQGKLPKPIRLSRRCSVWRASWAEDFLLRAEKEQAPQ